MSNIPRLDLPSGGWVEFNDPNLSIRARHVRELSKIIDNSDTYSAAISFAATDFMTKHLVTAWQLPYANVPFETPNAVDELTAQDFNALVNAVSPAILAAVAGRPYEPATEDTSEGEDVPATA